MKALVDKALCQGHGLCVLYAPDIFTLDDETGLAVVKSEAIESSQRRELIEAVNSCPVKAITLIED